MTCRLRWLKTKKVPECIVTWFLSSFQGNQRLSGGWQLSGRVATAEGSLRSYSKVVKFSCLMLWIVSLSSFWLIRIPVYTTCPPPVVFLFAKKMMKAKFQLQISQKCCWCCWKWGTWHWKIDVTCFPQGLWWAHLSDRTAQWNGYQLGARGSSRGGKELNSGVMIWFQLALLIAEFTLWKVIQLNSWCDWVKSSSLGHRESRNKKTDETTQGLAKTWWFLAQVEQWPVAELKAVEECYPDPVNDAVTEALLWHGIWCCEVSVFLTDWCFS